MAPSWFMTFLWGWLILAPITALVLTKIEAPYGRHHKGGWGPTLPSRWGWVLMEIWSPGLMIAWFILGEAWMRPMAVVFLAFWVGHYFNRTFVYPFRMRGGDRPMPWMIVVSAAFFNIGNTLVNGAWLFAWGPEYSWSWLLDPRFIVGALMFVGGYALNTHSDMVLRNLRKPGETGYKIPQQGAHRLVAAPNYLGEIIEWTGWAVMTWSLAGASFALWTAANLAPRAAANLRWYRETFGDEYPAERKALIPGIW